MFVYHIRLKSNTLDLNLALNCLTFMTDVSHSYVDCLYLLTHVKQQVSRHFNGQIPLTYSFVLSNILNKLQLKLDAKRGVKEGKSWTGLKAIKAFKSIEDLMDNINQFEHKLVGFYNLLMKKKV